MHQLRELFRKSHYIAEEALRTAEPALLSAVSDFSFRKKAIRSSMIKGLQPIRVQAPLVEAPLFSEDLQVFPEAALKEAWEIAKTVPSDDLRWPTPVSGYYHTKKRLADVKSNGPFKKPKLGESSTAPIHKPTRVQRT